jgi:hypothetical protein
VLLGFSRAPLLRRRAGSLALALLIALGASGGLAVQGGPAVAATARIHLVARAEPVRDVLIRLGETAHLN